MTATTQAEQQVSRHDLYRFADVEAASRHGRASGPFTGDPCEIPSPRSALEEIIDAGEAGCRRVLVHPTADAVGRVRALDERAPHMRAVTDLVVVRMRAALTIGLPLALPPVLLIGPPGIGKSWFMARLAAAIRVPYRAYAFNLASLTHGLGGAHPIWRASAPGLVAATLLREPIANPLFLVDELDKPPDARVGDDLYRPFHSLIEPETARAFSDECLGFPMDASTIMWVASANTVAPIPLPILDRLTIVEVGAMSPADRAVVVRSIYSDLNAASRGFFDDVPNPDLLDRLVVLPPRRAKLALEEGMARAAADGRRSVRNSDVPGSAPSPRPARTRGMH